MDFSQHLNGIVRESSLIHQHFQSYSLSSRFAKTTINRSKYSLLHKTRDFVFWIDSFFQFLCKACIWRWLPLLHKHTFCLTWIVSHPNSIFDGCIGWITSVNLMVWQSQSLRYTIISPISFKVHVRFDLRWWMVTLVISFTFNIKLLSS